MTTAIENADDFLREHHGPVPGDLPQHMTAFAMLVEVLGEAKALRADRDILRDTVRANASVLTEVAVALNLHEGAGPGKVREAVQALRAERDEAQRDLREAWAAFGRVPPTPASLAERIRTVRADRDRLAAEMEAEVKRRVEGGCRALYEALTAENKRYHVLFDERGRLEEDRDRLAARVAELEALCWADGPTDPKPEADADPCPVDAEDMRRWRDGGALGVEGMGGDYALDHDDGRAMARQIAWLTRRVAGRGRAT